MQKEQLNLKNKCLLALGIFVLALSSACTRATGNTLPYDVHPAETIMAEYASTAQAYESGMATLNARVLEVYTTPIAVRRATEVAKILTTPTPEAASTEEELIRARIKNATLLGYVHNITNGIDSVCAGTFTISSVTNDEIELYSAAHVISTICKPDNTTQSRPSDDPERNTIALSFSRFDSGPETTVWSDLTPITYTFSPKLDLVKITIPHKTLPFVKESDAIPPARFQHPDLPHTFIIAGFPADASALQVPVLTTFTGLVFPNIDGSVTLPLTTSFGRASGSGIYAITNGSPEQIFVLSGTYPDGVKIVPLFAP